MADRHLRLVIYPAACQTVVCAIILASIRPEHTCCADAGPFLAVLGENVSRRWLLGPLCVRRPDVLAEPCMMQSRWTMTVLCLHTTTLSYVANDQAACT